MADIKAELKRSEIIFYWECESFRRYKQYVLLLFNQPSNLDSIQ